MLVRKAAMATLAVASLCTRSAWAAANIFETTVPDEGLFTIGWTPGTKMSESSPCPEGSNQVLGELTDCAEPVEQIRKRFEAGVFYHSLAPELAISEYLESGYSWIYDGYKSAGGCRLRYKIVDDDRSKPYDFIPVCLVPGITSAPSQAPTTMPSMSPSVKPVLRAMPRMGAPPDTSGVTATIRSSYVLVLGIVATFVSISMM